MNIPYRYAFHVVRLLVFSEIKQLIMNNYGQ